MRVTHRPLAIAVTYLALIAGTAAMAAQVSSQSHDGYRRLLFRFDSEPTLSIGNSGTTLTLSFNQPLGLSPDAVAAQLGGYAKSASLSPDGKTLTVMLDKPFRTRQFRSGTSVGLDLIGDANPSAAAPQVASAPEKPAAAKPKPAPKSEKPPVKTALAAAVKKPAPPAKASAKPVVEKPKAETPPAPSPRMDEAMLSTKPPLAPLTTVAPPAEPVISTKAPAPDTDTETAAAPTPAPAPAEKPKAVAPPAPMKAEPAPAAVDKGPFIVTAQAKEGTTVIDFPWKQRTAAALFERARDVWVVFSRPADANAALLRTVMPKGVVDVTQYAYADTTVLRITTDGTLHAVATQPKGSYGWQVALSTGSKPASLDVPITGESTDGDTHLLLAAFDTAPTLRFYDPRIGDLLLVVPTYESGRGVSTRRDFPELDVLPTQQGITVASARDDITLTRTRIGIALGVPGGLAISENLATLGANAVPVAGGSATSDVMMPYDQWYVAPDQFQDARAERLANAAQASKAARPDALMHLVSLYLGQGMAIEAAGYLSLLHREYPDYYTGHKLALLDAAAAVLENHLAEAQAFIAAPELNDLAEAELWREVIGLYAPGISTMQQLQQDAQQSTLPAAPPPAPVPPTAPKADDDLEPTGKTPAPAPITATAPARPPFRFLKWNKPYIHFYPPKIRQRLALLAADAYLSNGQEEKALSTYETLNRDGILDPVKLYAEESVGEVAALRNQTKQALQAFDKLSTQPDDRYIATRARYHGIMLRYKKGEITADIAAEALERVRLGWRGDALAHQMLSDLAEIYREEQHYDDTLRTWRTMLDDFPGDPDTLKISGDMGDLFKNLFLNGLADQMPPLRSLALFYEFRDLTPIGDQGDQIIQKLADRLASVDLVDRATQLLEHQVKFRVSGEVRSKVGARLALLYLINHQPQEALDVLQITAFGANGADLNTKRQQLMAESLSKLGKNDEALSMLYNDTSKEGALLRLDILWSMQDWPNVVNRAEDILSARPNLTATLTPEETDVLLKLALGYAFEGDSNQLRYLRDYYTQLIPDSGYKEIFNFITNDTAPLDAADISLLTQQVNHTESFLGAFRSKIAAGKLSEAVK